MLSCKEVATQASDYLDQNIDGNLLWKIRLHLMMCSHCRRFVRHLRITRTVAVELEKKEPLRANPEAIYQRILARVKDK